MWEKFTALSLLAQLGLRSITPGSGFNTLFINFSLFMLERHSQWIKTSNLVDIPPSLGDIPEKYSGFSSHSWHSLSLDVMRTTMYSQRPGGQCSLLSFFQITFGLGQQGGRCAASGQTAMRPVTILYSWYLSNRRSLVPHGSSKSFRSANLLCFSSDGPLIYSTRNGSWTTWRFPCPFLAHRIQEFCFIHSAVCFA